MTNNRKNNNEPENYVELTNDMILEKAKEELSLLQKSLSEEQKTIDENKLQENIKNELQEINERIQGSNLEKNDKTKIGEAFDKLINLEEKVDENILKNEVDKIINLLQKLTKKDLVNLQRDIQHNEQWRNPGRPQEVQEQIHISSDNIAKIAANGDINPIANLASLAIGRCLS